MASHSQPLAEPRLRSGFLTTIAKKHPIALFLILAYALGWGMVTPRILSWLGIVRFNVPNWWVVTSFYAPAIAGLSMQWLTERNLKVFRVYKSLGKLVLGLAIGAFLVLVCNPSVPALLAERTPLRTLDWRIFLSLSSYHFCLSEPLTPIGEEIGWRGYALLRLQNRFGPIWASVLVGLMWAGFMLPALSLVQMWPIRGILVYAIALIALSMEMTFAMNLSGSSIIVAVAMNTLASAQSGYLAHGLIAHSHSRTHWELIAAASNLLIPAVLILTTRDRLGARRQGEVG
jgi:membrane protease YdiL (CAAX protease family)